MESIDFFLYSVDSGSDFSFGISQAITVLPSGVRGDDDMFLDYAFTYQMCQVMTPSPRGCAATEERKGSDGGETEAVNESARPYLEVKHTPVKEECTEHYDLTGKDSYPSKVVLFYFFPHVKEYPIYVNKRVNEAK
ncbi:hypothetical protein MG293_007184 [Ovis ammon polii]|uniref:Uncharacterized protein n=1 Tax=Ovis ammon polii TaxID=230172 RepID=A0AAD4YCQ1_OVIAM|nr:hypothetical protein MG293_007184 [Ovis ammon polii]